MTRCLSASKLRIERSKNPKAIDFAALQYGKDFTDHMLITEWTAQEGWGDPIIRPHDKISLLPASSALHYGVSCFEGMKAYKNQHGQIYLFRPEKNVARLNRSAARVNLPQLDEDAFLSLLQKLISLDERWIPSFPGFSLYIRPMIFGTTSTIGPKPTESALFMIILSPSPASSFGSRPAHSCVSLLASHSNIRAWPGGTGAHKIGPNYGPTIDPAAHASSQGYNQILWLYKDPTSGPTDSQITEAGNMNVFFLFKKNNESYELTTPSLEGGLILSGVTRHSILDLVRSYIAGDDTVLKELTPQISPSSLFVSERKVTIGELIQASNDGNLLEAFGVGTAVVIVSISRIDYQGHSLDLTTENLQKKGIGSVASSLYNTLVGIQAGRIPSPWAVPVVTSNGNHH